MKFDNKNLTKLVEQQSVEDLTKLFSRQISRSELFLILNLCVEYDFFHLFVIICKAKFDLIEENLEEIFNLAYMNSRIEVLLFLREMGYYAEPNLSLVTFLMSQHEQQSNAIKMI